LPAGRHGAAAGRHLPISLFPIKNIGTGYKAGPLKPAKFLYFNKKRTTVKINKIGFSGKWEKQFLVLSY